MDNKNDRKNQGCVGAFPSTHWSMLNNADSDAINGDDVLNWLVKRYWRPVYFYIRKKGNNDFDAQDLAQKFFLHWIEKNLFSRASPERGRFRNFLLTSLNNFLSNTHRDAQAACRFPAGGFISDVDNDGDYLHKLTANIDTPEELFHRVWLVELLQRVTRKFRDECTVSRKQIHYDIFQRRIIAPIIDGITPPSQRFLADKYNLSEKQVANYLLTARRAYQRLLKEEVRSYAMSETDAVAEISDLFEFISEQ